MRSERVVIPYGTYLRLMEDTGMLQDICDYDKAKKAIEDGKDLVPNEVTYAILNGENPIRIWREHRGFTQQRLAETAGISTPYLSQIESGKRNTDVLAALAKALGLSLDDIVSS